MGDSYVECLVEREKNTGFSVLRILMYVCCAVCVVLAMGGFTALFLVGVAFGLIGAFVVPASDIEYEYLYIGKELSIDKIIAKSKRKKAAEFDLNKMEMMCPMNSHELDSYKSKNFPIKDYSSKKADAKAYAIVYRDDKQECIVCIEPNTELLQAIKNVFPRKVSEY